MLAVRFSGRARNRMRLYRVTEADVLEAVVDGRIIAGDGPGLRYAWKQRGLRWLRVFLVEEPQRVKVVTLSLERRGPPREARAQEGAPTLEEAAARSEGPPEQPSAPTESGE